jgi:citronellol/citronellal dehydrogenase
MADAALEIFTRPARELTGRFLIDDEVMAAAGVRVFERYRVDPSNPLTLDLFVQPQAPAPPGSAWSR